MEEACEDGLTRGTCFVARRLEVVSVAVLMWIYFVVCSEWWDFVFFFFRFLYFERTRPAASMRPTCLIYLSTSSGGGVPPDSADEEFWSDGAAAYHLLFERSEFLIATCEKKKLTVCVCVCVCVCLANRQNTVYLCLSTYMVFGNTHAHRNCGQHTRTSQLWPAKRRA